MADKIVMLVGMSLMSRLERRLGWLAFPGFLRFYAILFLLVYLLQVFRPDIGLLLDFDRERILQGEVWRVVTFPFSAAGLGGIGPIGLVFMFFMMLITFMISDSLERAWGVFSTSMFCYTGILCLLVANFVLPGRYMGSGVWLYQTAFFAFATLFPKVEFRLFFVIPVQVRFLAWFMAVLMLMSVFRALWVLPFFLMVNLNYLLWAGIPALRGTARVVKSAKRRRRFEASKAPDGDAFHTCKECGRTDVSDPELEFRVGADGEEYCSEHLPE